jgi:hypothetical protein
MKTNNSKKENLFSVRQLIEAMQMVIILLAVPVLCYLQMSYHPQRENKPSFQSLTENEIQQQMAPGDEVVNVPTALYK